MLAAQVHIVVVALPVQGHIVVGLVEARLTVEHPLQRVAVGAAPALEAAHVLLPFLPVARIVAVLAGGVGKLQADGLWAVGLYAHGHHVAGGVAHGLHVVGHALVGEAAVYDARPQVEHLLYGGHPCGVGESESQASQVQSVRVLPVPFRSPLGTSLLLELRGVEFLMAVAEVESFQRLLRPVLLRVVERVPSPVAHGAQGHPLGIGRGKGLQPGGVDGEGEASVAHGERGERVHAFYERVVAHHHRLAVYGLCL